LAASSDNASDAITWIKGEHAGTYLAQNLDMKLVIGLCIAFLGAPLEAFGADRFGSAGTFLPKGALSLTHHRSGGPGVNASSTSISLAPELGYFVIDNLVLFASMEVGALFVSVPGDEFLFFGGGGGLGIGYHFGIGDDVGLLPQIGATIHHSGGKNTPGTTSVLSRVRLPIIITHDSFYFGIGPEVSWYEPIEDELNRSFVFGLFTELGAWL
jgi:hypothetical protein